MNLKEQITSNPSSLIDEGVRALWWKQPYASLMLHGKIETRIWPTDYRGLVLICASKKYYSVTELSTIAGNQTGRIYKKMTGETVMDTPDGVVIAIGRLVDCRPMTPHDSDKCFVEYISPWISINKNGVAKEKQLWCHIYEDVTEVEPFELKGCQGWLKLSPEIISQIKFK